MYYDKMVKQTIKEEYVRKNVTIKKKHEKYLKDKSISLSRFIQKKIDEVMK